MGDESDAHQCLDAEIPSGGAASGGRYSGTSGSRDVEICGISAFRGVVERAHEELYEGGPFWGSISWWYRSMASTSPSTWFWWRPLASTAKGSSIPSG